MEAWVAVVVLVVVVPQQSGLRAWAAMVAYLFTIKDK
jgi:hypothetical protein